MRGRSRHASLPQPQLRDHRPVVGAHLGTHDNARHLEGAGQREHVIDARPQEPAFELGVAEAEPFFFKRVDAPIVKSSFRRPGGVSRRLALQPRAPRDR